MTFSNIVEIYYDEAWHDITDDVQLRDGGIVIDRGRTGESSTTDASTCKLSLNNGTSKVEPTVSGRYAPRNPNSDLYGKIGRNTPLRVRTNDVFEPYALLSSRGDYIATSDKAAVSITGDIDIRFDGELTSNAWNSLIDGTNLCAKWDIGTVDALVNDQSWEFYIFEGALKLRWSTTGADIITKTSTATLPFSSGRHAVRATLDVNNGAAGNTVTFYTADTIAGPWTQLGSPVVTAGTTSLFNNVSDIEVGGISDLGQPDFVGKLYGFELRNGIAGTIVAEIDFASSNLAGQTDFSDGLGNTWELRRKDNNTGNDSAGPSAMIVNPSYRFSGEVSEWPHKWDPSGTDFYVPIEASGILRRLSRWNDPLQSAFRRQIPALPGVMAYWPLEDAEGSLQFESASTVNGGKPETGGSIIGIPEFASYDGFPSSAPLAVTGDDSPVWTFYPTNYASTGEVQVQFLMHLPSGGIAGATIVRILTRGTAQRWEVAHQTGVNGYLLLRCWDADNTLILTSSVLAFTNGLNDYDCMVSVRLTNDGSDVDWNVSVLKIGESSGEQHFGTLTGYQINTVSKVQLSPNGSATDTAFGHLTVENNVTGLYDRAYALNAFGLPRPENAAIRFARLSTENEIAAFANGSSSVKMGPQRITTLLDLIDDVEAADLGYLYEPREMLGLAYRTRSSMDRKDSVFELDYSATDLSEFDPTEDDQNIKNAITVSRDGGTTYSTEAAQGSLSIANIGKYVDSQSVNLAFDFLLKDNANWRLNLGTIDEMRFPNIGVELARDNYLLDSDLAESIIRADIGDRINITNTPNILPPEDISQIIVGTSEILTKFTRTINFVCVPASPHDVGEWSADDAVDTGDRYDTDDSELYGAVNSTQTTIEVLTVDGNIWTTDADDLPFDILVNGERMTVTDVDNGQLSFVNVGTGASGLNASVTPGLPTSTQFGDLVLIFASIRGTSATVNTPTNWTVMSSFSGTNVKIFGRIYDGVWTMPTVTFSGGLGTDDTLAQSCAFRGVSLTKNAQATAAGTAQNITTPALDVDKSGRLILWAGWKQDDFSSGVHANSLAHTINTRVSTAGNDAGQIWSYRIFGQATDVGSSSFTITGGASASYLATTIGLVPAQIFTVTRSVNGIVKSHDAFSDVRLAEPKKWSY